MIKPKKTRVGHNLSEEKIRKMKEMRSQDKSYSEISKKLGMSINAVRYHCDPSARQAQINYRLNLRREENPELYYFKEFVRFIEKYTSVMNMLLEDGHQGCLDLYTEILYPLFAKGLDENSYCIATLMSLKGKVLGAKTKFINRFVNSKRYEHVNSQKIGSLFGYLKRKGILKDEGKGRCTRHILTDYGKVIVDMVENILDEESETIGYTMLEEFLVKS
jgi:hypothetical protein